MKSIAAFCFLLLFFASCVDNNEPAKSENDVDAARNFIRAALDGDYAKARTYMLQDSLNTQLLNTFEDNYRTHMNSEDKRGYRESSIQRMDVRKLSDSVSIVKYSNSYMNKLDSLKVVNVNGTWVIDFKYSFQDKSATK